MKKLISLLALLISFSISAQQPLIKPKQIEGSTAGSILTTTGTGVPTWTTTIPAGVIPTFSTYWSIAGNSITGTPFLGTTNNRTLDFKTNNTKRVSIDSVGILKMGSPTYTDSNIWTFNQGSSNNYFQSIWSNTNNGNAASVDLVVSNDLGTKSTYYGNFGMNSSTYTGTSVFNQPNVVYLTSQSAPLSIGTLSNNSIYFAVNNIQAMKIDSSGNVYSRGRNNLTQNIAYGFAALATATGGVRNVAVGDYVLGSLTNGTQNNGYGFGTLFSLTTGSFNTAYGTSSGFSNLSGAANTFIGYQAALSGTIGDYNTFIGGTSGSNNNGTSNTGVGYNSLVANNTGSFNTCVGHASLGDVLNSYNTAIGYNTGRGITTGSNNTIVGARVTGLSAGLSNNIILADGVGNIRYQNNSTTAFHSLPITIGSTVAPTATLDVRGTTALNGNVTMSVGTAAQGIYFQGLVGGTTVPALYFNQSSPSGNNYGISGDIQYTNFNAAINTYIRANNVLGVNVTSTSVMMPLATRIGSTNVPTATLDVTGTMSVSSTATIQGNLYTPKIYGNSSAPTVTAGSGLGTGAGTVISVIGNDMCGIIGVTTGTASLGTSAVLTYITFNSAYTTNAPIMSIQPYNLAAQNLIKGQEVYPSAATTTFAINTNTVALTASTTYSFSYKALGR